MKIDGALNRITGIEDEASGSSPVHRFHPLAKLFVTAAFLGVTLSFGRYELSRVLVMCVYPFAVFTLGGISFLRCIKRIWPVVLFMALFGVGNIFFDREIMFCVGRIRVSYGIISALVLIFKGVLTVMSVYLLMASTGIDNICFGLSLIHIPGIIVTQIMLTYRYMSVLIFEAGEIFNAYRLRAPGQRGVNIKAWGSLLGQLLIRASDRAQAVYDSMRLRGSDGSFPFRGKYKETGAGIVWALVWCAIFVLLRVCDPAGFIGGLIL